MQHPISEKGRIGSGTYLYASHMWGSGYAWTCILFPTAERVRRYEGNGFEGMKRVVRPQPVMQEWKQEALLRRFGLPADWVPATPADLEDFESRCVDLLRDPANRSGFKEVYPCLGTKPWQAKVYDCGTGEAATAGMLRHPAGSSKGNCLVAHQWRQAQVSQEGAKQAW